MPEFDSPWKEALDDFLQPFHLMFFPKLESRIDWSVLPESLDNELAKLFPDGVVGKKFVDRLYKVRLLDGADIWVLIHIEIQSQRDDAFPGRLYRYFSRLQEKFDLPITCLVVLADESLSWRPCEYVYEFEGTRMQFTFPTVKLADYQDKIEELERSDNLFALIVLAHLQSQRVRENEDRLEWKRRITRNLLERDIDELRRWKVIRLLDWFIDIPVEWNAVYWTEVKEWKERKVMPYVTSLERMIEKDVTEKVTAKVTEQVTEQVTEKVTEKVTARVRQEALLEGLEIALEAKFHEAGKAFAEELKANADISKLRSILRAINGADSIEDLRRLP